MTIKYSDMWAKAQNSGSTILPLLGNGTVNTFHDNECTHRNRGNVEILIHNARWPQKLDNCISVTTQQECMEANEYSLL
jgi:hypothetical protein